ncbi:glycosyltransferase [Kocuria arenosa]|uniref:glycosyltransferase n=1 Tax=Kocuria arenosa TaxID=3071446 RepID=UPI0034D4D27A
MKILQIVTYISPDGAYGGPVRVAINQAKALTDLGHEVVLAATAGGFRGPLPHEFDGFPVTLFPARRLVPGTGFAGMTSPGLLRWLRMAILGADVVHVHLARDLVTLPAAALAILFKKPVVIQTHGMIDFSAKLLARPLDCIFTRPVLKQAGAVLFLTKRECGDLVEVAGDGLKLQFLPNGVDLRHAETYDLLENAHHDREVQVLYLARLHARKRPLTFVKAATYLLHEGSEATFHLVGPDEGEGKAIKSAIESAETQSSVIYEGPAAPHETYERLSQSDIYVLPSIDEPFPMSVIEAMASGKPVIVTDSCGLAPYVKSSGAGIIIDDKLHSLTQAIDYLVRNRDKREAMGNQGRQLVEREFRIQAVATRLAHIYQEVSLGRKVYPNEVDV